MLPSSPPPAPRCPGLAKAGVDVYRLAIRDVIRAFSREYNVSIRDWVAISKSDIGRVQKVLDGRAPWPREWEAMLPTRWRRELEPRIAAAIESLSRLSA